MKFDREFFEEAMEKVRSTVISTGMSVTEYMVSYSRYKRMEEVLTLIGDEEAKKQGPIGLIALSYLTNEEITSQLAKQSLG